MIKCIAEKVPFPSYQGYLGSVNYPQLELILHGLFENDGAKLFSQLVFYIKKFRLHFQKAHHF